MILSLNHPVMSAFLAICMPLSSVGYAVYGVMEAVSHAEQCAVGCAYNSETNQGPQDSEEEAPGPLSVWVLAFKGTAKQLDGDVLNQLSSLVGMQLCFDKPIYNPDHITQLDRCISEPEAPRVIDYVIWSLAPPTSIA